MLTLFAGMLLHDREFVDSEREHTPQYPAVTAQLQKSITAGNETNDHIMPWCWRVEQQLGDAKVNKIVLRPSRSPRDVTRGWDQTRDFLMSLSWEVNYRKVVRSIEDLNVRH